MVSQLKIQKSLYCSKQLDLNKDDVLKSWKTLRIILGLDAERIPKKIRLSITNITVTNSYVIANGFNDYFVSVGLLLTNDIIPTVYPLSHVENVNNGLDNISVSCAEVERVIKSINNSSAGWDKFPFL